MPRLKTAAAFAAALLAFTLPTSADLVAHYAFDETDGAAADAADSIGANHGSIIGGTGNVTKGFASPKAYLGTAYDFALRGGVDLGASTTTRPIDQWTMTWWMRPTTLNSFDRIYETLTGTGASGNGIRIDLGGNPGDSLRVLIRDGNGATSTQHTHSLNMSVGSWYFCAVRYDSTEGDGSALKITTMPAGANDIDAADVAAATQQAGSLGTGPVNLHGQGAYLAADDPGASGSNDFGGALDDFAIFQTGDAFGVLSDADIAQVHNVGALAIDPPAPRPTVQSFTATPEDVAGGANFTLAWDVIDADTVTIEPDVGAVAVSGSTSLTADVTKIYTLTATNAEGSTVAQTQITVDGLALPPRLSEFVASNTASLIDGDGNSPDWIEIFNPNATPFDLSGYYLTDNAAELDLWPFPAGTVIAGGEFLVVFASNQPTSNYIDGGGNLHTNFALGAGGGYLALVAPDGTTVLQSYDPYPSQQEDVSFGEPGYFSETTPGAANTGGFQGFVEDTKFSIDRGFFSAPFDVAITTDTVDAEIYTTTDGSEPTPTNGALYTAPITITTTTVLRAAAFKEGFAPTNTDTHTYLFLEDVLDQPNNPPGLPTLWAGKIADYEMDPDIVDSAAYGAEMIPSLQEFATLSVTLDPDDFYGPQGIYQNPQSQGDAWERAASAELITHDGSEPGFQIDAGIRIQGGSSRNPDTPKHSMSLRFRKQYGEGKLRYDLFEDAPSGDTATDEFDFLQLRSGYNYGWVHRHWYQGENAQYARDQFASDLFLAMGNTGTHGRWMHLYINGIYWGVYNVHERPDSNYMASYFGGSNDDYDAINSNQATDGTTTAYNTMASRAANNIADPTNYEALKDHLDISSFIDYMLMNFYVGNQDWDGHNWRAAGQGPGGVPFHFFPWDTEICISPFGGGRFDPPTPVEQSLTSNVTGKNGNNRPTGIHQDLTTNAEYRLQFADHVRRNMFNGGPLSPEGAAAIWTARSDAMFTGIVAESARWGDYRFDVQQAANWPQSSYQRYHRDDQYLSHQSWILNTYLPQRTDIVLGQLRARNLYPGADAPDFAQHGGNVPEGYALAIANPNAGGAIYYTLDGTDPRQPATAAVDIVLLDEGAPATALVQTSDGGLGQTWTAIGFDDTGWETGTTGIGYETSAGAYTPLIGIDVISMRGANASCLIRVPFDIPDQATLDNIATLTLNMKYDDGYVAFINGSQAAFKNADPGSLAWNSGATTSHADSLALQFEPVDISAAIPNLVVGDNMLAIHGLNSGSIGSDFLIVPQITYGTASASGVSPTAQLYSGAVTLADSGTVNARVLDGGEWSALTSAPFLVGTPADATNLVVSELHYNPSGPDESGEFIELANISADTIQLGGITFTAGLTYTAPLGLEIAPGGRHVLTPVDYEGNLDNTGENLALADAAGTVIESFRYNDKSPWPEAPDGDGPSLVRIAPEAQLDPNLPTSWRSSSEVGGNPGATDATTFPGGDLADYAFAIPPSINGLEVTAPRNPTADDLVFEAEVSVDMLTWMPAGDLFSSEDTTLKVTLPAPPGERYFVRFRATER